MVALFVGVLLSFTGLLVVQDRGIGLHLRRDGEKGETCRSFKVAVNLMYRCCVLSELSPRGVDICRLRV